MRLESIGSSSFTFAYRIEREATLLCLAKTVHVAIDRTARTKRALPDASRSGCARFDETGATGGSRSA